MHAGQDATDFLQWLSSLVAEALRASQQHDSLKRAVRELRASLEDKFALAAIQARRRPRMHAGASADDTSVMTAGFSGCGAMHAIKSAGEASGVVRAAASA
jgi:hypothetical protein